MLCVVVLIVVNTFYRFSIQTSRRFKTLSKVKMSTPSCSTTSAREVTPSFSSTSTSEKDSAEENMSPEPSPSTNPDYSSSPGLLSSPVLRNIDQNLYVARIRFDPTDGKGKGKKALELDAVYQDTLPSGSSVGTVVAVHGSPGSHADFKYITPLLVAKGIRVIGINFPGFGQTEDHIDLSQENTERNTFVEALLDGLDIRERIVFLGHSRGAENAIKLSARNIDRTIGTVVVAPSGLRVKNYVALPLTGLSLVRWTYESFSFLRPLIGFAAMNSYKVVLGLKPKTGRVAVNVMKSMSTAALGDQGPYMERIMEHPHVRVLVMYTCKDHILDTQISREFASTLKDRKHFNVKTKEEFEDAEVAAAVKKELISDTRPVTVEFALDSHYMQKSRARFIAEGIEAICLGSLKKEDEPESGDADEAPAFY